MQNMLEKAGGGTMKAFGFDATSGKACGGLLLIWLVLLALSAPVQGAGTYEISWYTIDGGGKITSGDYALVGTIGQPDAGAMSGGSYELLGGFWPGGPLCIVDFQSFALFAEHWLEAGCDAGNNFCGGADLNHLGDVDLIDFGLFVDEWLYYCPYGWLLK